MSPCRTVEFVYALVPFKPWRGFLLRRHIEGCPRCLAGLASREEAGSLLVRDKAVDSSAALWSKVEAALLEETRGVKADGRVHRSDIRRRWGWAVATACLGAVLVSLLFLKDFRTGPLQAGARPARFELDYVRVGGQPADAVVYQPQGSDMIIVWAGKSPAVPN